MRAFKIKVLRERILKNMNYHFEENFSVRSVEIASLGACRKNEESKVRKSEVKNVNA